MVFGDAELVFDESCFQKCDGRKYYSGACEAIPPDALKVQGQSVSMNCFVDADNHAACCITCFSHTSRVMTFLNQQAPILLYSKQQNTIEASTLDLNSLLQRFHWKWKWLKGCMVWVQMDGPMNVFYVINWL